MRRSDSGVVLGADELEDPVEPGVIVTDRRPVDVVGDVAEDPPATPPS